MVSIQKLVTFPSISNNELETCMGKTSHSHSNDKHKIPRGNPYKKYVRLKWKIL